MVRKKKKNNNIRYRSHFTLAFLPVGKKKNKRAFPSGNIFLHGIWCLRGCQDCFLKQLEVMCPHIILLFEEN